MDPPVSAQMRASKRYRCSAALHLSLHASKATGLAHAPEALMMQLRILGHARASAAGRPWYCPAADRLSISIMP